MNVGDLVIFAKEPERGVGRIERFLDDGRVRVWLYARGEFFVCGRDELAPCPPNTPVAPRP